MRETKGDGNALAVHRLEGETDAQALARALLDPCIRHGFTAMPFIGSMLDKAIPLPGGGEMSGAVKTLATRAEAGDMSFVSRMLAAQALTLDAIFGEFTRRTALNMGTHFGAAERYARLALKAQSNSRATLEALAKLHQPREQTVRHIHVNEGGQAIVADQVHHYAGGAGSAEPFKQSHAARSAGQCTAMPCPDPEGRGLSVSDGEGPEAMPDARRHKPRRA